MKSVWTVLEYDRGTSIQWAICHPQIAKQREQYLREKYGVEPTKKDTLTEAWVDFGGAVFVDEPQVIVKLGKNRTVGFFKFHADRVAARIRRALEKSANRWPKGQKFIRIQSHPLVGTLLFLSHADAYKILKVTDKIESAECDARRMTIAEVFVEAAVKQGSDEAEVREALGLAAPGKA